ncbi:MAG TPA: peptidoglycan endopeptidase [Micromonosporaceae bacterium]|nr:peptidoglycan endopeptidase [Micromonosporaceae bacterium]
MTTKRLLSVVLGLLLGLGSVTVVSTTAAHANGCGVLAGGASPAARRAITAACRQVGVHYAWGGGHNGLPGPSQGYHGLDPATIYDPLYWSFDCSGLVRWAWFEATGVDIIGRSTAHDAWNKLSRDPANRVFTPADGSGPLLPGDILYYGDVSHTALYLGAGKMVEARQSGDLIKVSDWRSERYKGAVRLRWEQPDPPFRYPGEGAVFKTWGKGNYRTDKNTGSQIKYTSEGGSVLVRVLCQADGEQVTVSGITNRVWSYLPEYEVWVSNIFIQGPAVLPGVPPCSQYIAIGGEFTTPGGTDKAFSTWGTNVRVKSEPNTGSGTVHNFPGPTGIQVGCQKHAQTVTSDGYTNDVWSYLPEYGGWMTNIYIRGAAWLAGVPDCGGGTGGGGAATCADNSVPSGSGARSPRTKVLFGRTIELRYSDATQCAWGRISNGSIGDEIWVDRSSNRGESWEPRLGLTSITSGRDVYTRQWRDAGVVMRACGRAGDRPDIECTDWF